MGSHSGRVRLLGKQVGLKGPREFESRPHRQKNHMALLTPEEIKARLKDMPGWQLDSPFLRKEFVLPSFTDAMVFVNEVAQAAEDMSHHPDLAIHQNTVKISTTTHDMEGVTEKDIELVKRAQEAEKMIFGDLGRA